MMLNVISLGAGVQSSTMALMAAHGEITPMPDCAIFADTQSEPRSVYAWLDWLTKQLPFPVYRVTAGNLTDDGLQLAVSKRSGKKYWKTLVPFYIQAPDGTKGMIGRKYTADYKVAVLERQCKLFVSRRERLAHKPGMPPLIMKWLGISRDETYRRKESPESWSKHHWPLIDLNMTRADCLAWMERNGYPRPPRSACVYCPYHSDEEWLRLKTDEPEEFARAVAFEAQAQAQACQVTIGKPFLHDSMKPLPEIDFSASVYERSRQFDMFNNECEGMCGV